MIRILHYSQKGQRRTDLQISELPAALQDPKALIWVDMVEEPAENCDGVFREVFHFHPLAMEDALHEIHAPKIDDWRSYLYLVLHALEMDPPEDSYLSTLELDTFLGRNFIVTYQQRGIPALNRLWRVCLEDDRILKRGASFLLYRVVDEMVASYVPVLDKIEDAIDEIEDEIFTRPTPHTLERIFQLKRALLRLRRVITPQREVVQRLGREVYPVVNRDYRVFFRDVQDHLNRMDELSESRRDLVNSAMDTYLSAVNNRMNDVMKALATFTALFMPISFLTGFFGMNFFQPSLPLNAWTGALAFLLVLLAVVVVPGGMFFWMKRRGWF